MGGGVVTAYRPVPALANDLIVMHQHRAHRHLALFPGAFRQRQGMTHPVFIIEFEVRHSGHSSRKSGAHYTWALSITHYYSSC